MNGRRPTLPFSLPVTVTIFPILSPTTVQYIANHSDSKMIFVENQEQLEKVLSVWERLPQLKQMIVFEPLTAKPRANIYTVVLSRKI